MKFRIALATATLGVLAFAGRADATNAALTLDTTCTSYTLHVGATDWDTSAGGDVYLWGDATGGTDPTQVLRGRLTPNATLDFAFTRTARTYGGGVSIHFDSGHISNRSYTVIVPSCDGATTVATPPTLPPTAPATTTTTVVCTGSAGGPPLATCPSSTTGATFAPDPRPTFDTTTSTTLPARVAGITENATTTTSLLPTASTLPSTGAVVGIEPIIAAGLLAFGVLLCVAVVVGPRRSA